MSEETKNKIYWLFAKCLAFVFVFLVVGIVGGFYAARLLGLPVDLDRFYGILGPAFFMILGAVINMFPRSKEEKND